ncbi:MAG TPA: hypothetical protein ENJ95_00790, partial [Bacteroidetes bacterium]|nr:hypothetical protein [Bacteroidota bacterium]
RMLRREPLVVLYGKSGLGKSSLINAGIIPECRKTGEFAPITVRFGAWTEGTSDTPLGIAKKTISEGHAAPTFLDRLLPGDASLWYCAKTRQLNKGGRPLLIFDQFEELFTYPEEAVQAFKEELSELLHTGIPLRFRRMADAAAELSETDEDRLEEALDARIVFAIRSDRMALLHQLADRLPNILRSMYKLRALQPDDAKRAILLPAVAEGDFRTPPFEWAPAALASLLAFLQDPDDEQRVEGILLQLLCQYFEEKKVEGAGLSRLGANDLGNLEEIVEQYYFEKIASLGDADAQLSARRLIEEGLVLEGENIRLSLHEAQIKRQFKVDTPLLERLVDSRLLRAEPFLRGGYSYELAHDRLVPPVLAAKEQRRVEEAKAEQLEKERQLAEARRKAEEERRLREQAERGRRRATIFTVVAVIGLAVAAWQYFVADSAKTQAELDRQEAIKSKEVADQKTIDAKKAAADAKKQKEIADQKSKDAEESAIEAKRQEGFAKAAKTTADEERDKAKAALAKLEKKNADVVRLILVNAERDVLNLRYEDALKKIKAAASIGALKQEVAKALLETAFWHGESGKMQRATGILDTAATLVGNSAVPAMLRSLPSGPAAARERLRDAMKAIDPLHFSFLFEKKYYPEMVEVEGGTFNMGCDTTLNQGCDDDETLHPQEVSSFKMAKYETTVWQFALYCAAIPELDINDFLESNWSDPGNNPVVNVSWYQAVEYANWVSGQKGANPYYMVDKENKDTLNFNDYDDLKWTVSTLPNAQRAYRLPTEAEWEYAAKGGKYRERTIYSGNNVLDSVGWYGENSGSRTHPAGTRNANALGLYDMSGNVWEWCWDWCGGYDLKWQVNPQGAKSGSSRVSRGGGWYSRAQYCRVSDRYYWRPVNRDDNLGIRLARSQ